MILGEENRIFLDPNLGLLRTFLVAFHHDEETSAASPTVEMITLVAYLSVAYIQKKRNSTNVWY